MMGTAAFEVLVEAEWDRVYAACLRHLRSQADAEDQTQEAFLRLAANFDRVEGNPAAYVMAIARNLCRKELRRQSRLVAGLDDDAVWATSVDPERRAIDRADVEALRHGLARRDWLALHASAQGYGYREIAAFFRVSAGAMAVRLTRVRQRAAQLVQEGRAAWLPQSALQLRWGRLRIAAGRDGSPLANVTAASVLAGGLVAGMVLGPVSAGRGASAAQGHRSALTARSGSGFGANTPTGLTLGDPLGSPILLGPRRPPSQASPEPPPSPQTVAQIARRAVDPNSDGNPSDWTFSSVAASPSYGDDHTLLAIGSSSTGGAPFVFSSTDGGLTWRPKASTHLAGTQLLLVPSRSAATVFAAGPGGLQRSDDGGASFGPPLTGGGPAALVPASGGSGPRILVGSAPVLLYDVANGTTAPGPVLPPGVTAINGLAVLGDTGQAALAFTPTSASGTQTVLLCPLTALPCSTGPTLASHLATARFAVSPAFASDRTLFLDVGTTLYASSDGGQSFSDQGPSVSPAARGSAHTPSLDAIALAPDFASSRHLVAAVYVDVTQGWSLGTFDTSSAPVRQVERLQPQRQDLTAIAWLPGGGLVALPAGGGIMLSGDGGATWRWASSV